MIHFHTDSYPMTIKRVSCDKEIGHYKRGWHTCNRAAIVRVESKVCKGLYLDYCRKHAPKMYAPAFEQVATPEHG